MDAPTLNGMIDNGPKAEIPATSAVAVSLLLRSVSYSPASLQGSSPVLVPTPCIPTYIRSSTTSTISGDPEHAA